MTRWQRLRWWLTRRCTACGGELSMHWNGSCCRNRACPNPSYTGWWAQP